MAFDDEDPLLNHSTTLDGLYWGLLYERIEKLLAQEGSLPGTVNAFKTRLCAHALRAFGWAMPTTDENCLGTLRPAAIGLPWDANDLIGELTYLRACTRSHSLLQITTHSHATNANSSWFHWFQPCPVAFRR